MRRGEIINLNWTDVDFKNSIITVQVSKNGKKRMLPMDDTLCETLRVLPTRFQKGYLFPSPVKEGQPCYDFKRQFGNAVKKAGIENFRFHDLRHTFASHLVMSGVDLMTVKELHRNRRQEWLEQGRNEIPAWIFCNQEGNPADMHNLKNRHFFKCLEKAGLRRIRFHELRHTFASLLIQNGESLAYIKDQLGHSSIKLTVDVYGHLVPGANREAVNRLPSLKAAGAHRAISGLQT